MADSRELALSMLKSALCSPDEDALLGYTVQDSHLEMDEHKDAEYLASATQT